MVSNKRYFPSAEHQTQNDNEFAKRTRSPQAEDNQRPRQDFHKKEQAYFIRMLQAW